MPSTDIDGSPIVILSEAEARRVYEYLQDIKAGGGLDALDRALLDKITRDLRL